MKNSNINPFNIIGLAVRTTNENGQAVKDIPVLWGKFLGENKIADIPGIVENNIHCVYTDYEGDHTKPYTVLLGMKVSSLENIPEGMTGMSFAGGNYSKHSYAGDLTTGLVTNAWHEIWKTSTDRAFTADFEVYDASKPNPNDTAVDIFIAHN